MVRIGELNEAQRQAVLTLQGPLLVLAGAGTGKTRVITYRIAKLIRSGIQPDRILAVTFTNKAANEMQERILPLIGKRSKLKPFVSTFHSLCVQVLRRHITRLGYPERFAIYDRGDQESLARSILRDVRVLDQQMKPSQLLYLIGNWKNRSIRPEEAVTVAETDQEHLAAMAYRRYQRNLKQSGAVDFDDLLLCTEQLFREFDDVREDEAKRFDHILVDEYQDTNGGQYRIIRDLAMAHQNLCVVGDDDQSIYGWRGAEVEHILGFKRDWPDAKVVRLEENYRSTQSIIDVANRLIEFNSKRHPKVLRAARAGGLPPQVKQYPNEAKEAVETVLQIRTMLEQPGCEPRDFAILFRTNEQPRAFETELRKFKMPYVLIGGMSFFDRKEVKDVLSYLRLIENPEDDISLLRVINTPPRGLGAGVVKKLIEQSLDQKQPVWESLRNGLAPPFSAAAIRGADQLVELLDEAKRELERGGSLVDLLRNLIDRCDYQREIDRQHTDPNERESRWASVEQVVNSLAAFEAEATGEISLSKFLDAVALGDRELEDEKQKQLARNAIVLMTLHSAKGLEFPNVFMVGMEEGVLPHHRSVETGGAAIDEERRLCYVGVTRAQEHLTLSLPLSRMKWGRPRDTVPSRFLYELIGKADHPNYAGQE